jgi:hypothetical protein
LHDTVFQAKESTKNKATDNYGISNEAIYLGGKKLGVGSIAPVV